MQNPEAATIPKEELQPSVRQFRFGSCLAPCDRIGGFPAVMSNVNLDPSTPADVPSPQEESSFADILSSFEQQHHADAAVGGQTFNGTIVSVRPDVILIDIGRKIEGSLSVSK